jgi:hypothetical protein
MTAHLHHEARLVADPAVTLGALRNYVRRQGLASQDQWREVERHHGDQHAYFDFSARRAVGSDRVLFEFGLQQDGQRHLVGFLDAYWNPEDQDFGVILSACLEGRPASLEQLNDWIESSVRLPLVGEAVATAA